MLARYYLSEIIGTGSDTDAFRPALRTYVDYSAGEKLSWYRNTPRKYCLCIMQASQAKHDLVVTDAKITAVGSTVEYAEMPAYLQTLLNSVPNVATVKTKLESIGISTSWLSGTNTLQDGLRYLMRIFSISQWGDNHPFLKDLILANLATTIADIPAAVRNSVKTWMQDRGLATGWIKNTSTVREILHFIVMNLGFGKFPLVLE